MPSKELTEEEIRIIMENPYTLNVFRNKFMLTKEGKEKVLILAESGKTIRQIMIELGYDPQMLGHNRTKNIIRLIKKQSESREGIHNGYATRRTKRLTPDQIAELEQNPASYAKLKNEVIYLREEVELLRQHRTKPLFPNPPTSDIISIWINR